MQSTPPSGARREPGAKVNGLLARSFHDRTRHSLQSVRTPRRPERVEQPERLKHYPDLPLLPLPLELGESDWPAVDALAGHRPPNRAPMDLHWLASVLFYAAGITRRGKTEGSSFRAAPSAGARYPIEVYVACGDLGELPAGLYHFEPGRFGLQQLRVGDPRAFLSTIADAPRCATAPFTLLLTGVPWRSTWRTGWRGYRHLWWDAGAMIANTLALATAANRPADVVTGFIDGELSTFLALDADEEVPLAVVPMGDDGDPAPGIRRPQNVSFRSTRLAPADGPDHELLTVHRAGDLVNAAGVRHWRATSADAAQLLQPADAEPPLVDAYDSIEEVILQRGSTRRFAHAVIPAEALLWPLAVAGRSAGFEALGSERTLLTRHVVVHSVAGTEPGVYRVDGARLEQVTARDLRDETALVCLEQSLGGDSAYTVFHTVDLDRVLDEPGERGYRLAQLEAGVAIGRLQLAACALGLGATPLTFYDDESRRLLNAGGEVMTVVAVGPSAYDARPGLRPARQGAVG